MTSRPTMDPAYGDDLWAAGFSSDEDESMSREKGSHAQDTHDLDLLTSLVEKTENTVTMVTDSKVDTRTETDKTETFEESLTKPDNMSLMKAKMQAMEKELQQLREQVGTGPAHNRKRPHPQSNTAMRKSDKPSPKPAPVMSSIAMATKSSTTSLKRSLSANRGASGVNDRSVAEGLITQRQQDKEINIHTDTFSGIRIKNPLVSSELMKRRMQGRKMIRIPIISSNIRGNDIEGDWVTMGVVVDKFPPKESAKGNKYTVWKLSDLSSQSAVVTLFLFGKAYQEHWKMVQGSVIALLNPTIMPNRETGTVDSTSKQLALSLDQPQRLMPLGTSQDFTICRATTKAGRKCTNFAKTSDGGHCDYHIQGAYKKIRTGRMDCQGGYGPSAANLRGKMFKNSKTDIFYYGGKSYTAGGGSGGNSDTRNSGGQDKRLFARGIQESVAQVSQELKEKRGEREEVTAASSSGKKLITTSSGGDIFQQMLSTQRPGAKLLNRHLEKENLKTKEATCNKLPEKSASELLKEERLHGSDSNSTVSPFQPMLGRGLVPGSVVDLAGGRGLKQSAESRKSASRKAKAVSILRHKRQNGNETDDILHRVQENRGNDLTSKHGASSGEEDVPLIKKRKLDTAEMGKILNAKSSHDWAAKEVEWGKEEQYFTQREKKEEMEQRLATIKELNVYVSQCKQCGYEAETASELCRKEAHPITRHKAIKRWFECQDCHERACTYNARYPAFPCRKCSSKTFKQTSLYKERKGPKVGSENLLLRGREEKFLH